VLAPILATDDPLACVALAGARLMLGTSLPEFLPAESRAHKGAGVEFHVAVPSAGRGVNRRFTRSCLATGS
jgi:hypothetical protein